MRNGRKRTWLHVIATALLMSGCATAQSAIMTQEPFQGGERPVMKVEYCQDLTGSTQTRNLQEEGTRLLTEKLQTSGRFEISPDAPLALRCAIEGFAEGSALKRWAGPWAGGTTKATVAVTVWDMVRDKMLTLVRTQAVVEGGGLYSMGADRYILGAAFDDVVKQLEVWAQGPDGGPSK